MSQTGALMPDGATDIMRHHDTFYHAWKVNEDEILNGAPVGEWLAYWLIQARPSVARGLQYKGDRRNVHRGSHGIYAYSLTTTRTYLTAFLVRTLHG